MGEGIVREFGMDMYTLLFLKWIINTDLLYSTGVSVQCYVVAWIAGESGGEWLHVCAYTYIHTYIHTYIYIWLSPFAVYL